jgi:HK97 family phage major capsid protein/HK97 family phage prohead protease
VKTPTKLKPLTRYGEIRAADAKERTIELSFSSEHPVERWFGVEILDHGKKSARLDRLNDGAPVLFNHDMDDLRGVVEKAWIGEDRRGYAVVRLADTEEGNKALALVNDRILRNVSFMYRVIEWEMTETSKDQNEDREYRVTDWEALEISLVTIPADPTVGIGRAARSFTLDEIDVRLAAPAAGAPKMAKDTPVPETRVEIIDDPQQKGADLAAQDAERVKAIRNLAKTFKFDATEFIAKGTSVLDVTAQVSAMQDKREEEGRSTSATFLDMEKPDKERYSIMRALRAVVNNDWNKAGLELKASKAVSDKLHKLPRSERSFFIPLDIMLRDMPRTQKRDMTVAGVSGSNYLVGTDNMPGSFIDLLRNTSVALRMGVQRLSGLVGNVTIPKMTAGNTAYWLADETTQITESQPTLGQLALAPKNVAALTELSHQLMQQSTPDAETLVLTSIARDIGLAVDVGVLRGAGSGGEPTGIATTGSIGAFTGTSLASPGVLNAQADVATANALYPGCGYVTTPTVASLLMDRPNVSSATDGTPLWQGGMGEGVIRGYPALSSAQMSTATMLFGWWPSVILAEWGVLELMVNPYSDFTRGLSAVRGWYTCDVGVRYAGAWSYASSIT